MAEIYAVAFLVVYYLVTLAITLPEYARSRHPFLREASIALVFAMLWHVFNGYLTSLQSIPAPGYVFGNILLLAAMLPNLLATVEISGARRPTLMVPTLVVLLFIACIAHLTVGNLATQTALSMPAVIAMALSAWYAIQHRNHPGWWVLAILHSFFCVSFIVSVLYLLQIDPEVGAVTYFLIALVLPVIGLVFFQGSRNITKRNTAERERNFRLMFEAVQETFVRFDRRGNILEVSPSISRFGYARESLIGKSLTLLYQVPSKFSQDLARMHRDKLIPTLPLKLKTGTGETRDSEISVTAIRDDQGDVTDFVATIRDVDERNQLERQFLDAQRRESMGVMAGGIAHDFNNILQGIVGHAEWMLHSPEMPGRNREEHLQIILEASATAANLCRQLLEYTGRSHTNMTRVVLQDAVRIVLDMTRHSTPANVTLEADLNAQALIVVADDTQLRQVILNLVQNAVEALGDGGRVAVSVRDGWFTREELSSARPGEYTLPPGHYGVVTVADDGKGMDEEAMIRMFDPFFSTKSMGHGLGLAAVIGITRSHGGGVLVESAPGTGTTIRVLLPLTSEAPDVAEAIDPDSGGEDRTILIADDEKEIRDVLESMLTTSGYQVLTARDGEDAVARFMAYRDTIDAIIMDIKMPRKDGLAAIRDIRAFGSQVPILVASGYTEVAGQVNTADALNYRFVAKPYRRETLLRSLAEIL